MQTKSKASRPVKPPRPETIAPAKPRGRPKARLLSIDETAAYLGVSKRTIYRLIDSKNFPCYRIGWVLRFDLPTVLNWAENFTSSGDRLTWSDDYPQINRDQ